MKNESISFVKSVSVLLSGTFLAQLISIAFLPLISRIYGPEENAYLGLFLKITTLAATLSTARLELVLPTEKLKHYAFGVYQFSFYLSSFISFICFAFLVIYIGFTNHTTEDIFFLLSIPIGILLISFFNLGNNWELRSENYRSISFASILLSLTTNAFKIIGGLFSGHFLFLIGATLFGYIAASFKFIRRYFSERNKKILSYKSKRTKLIVKENKNFYTYNLFHVVIDLSRDMIIASFIWMYFSKLDFGSYEFAFRMMKLPIVFLATAMSQVFFRKAKDVIKDPRALKNMTQKTIFYSFLIGVLPFTIVFFYSEEIFVFIFGNKWAEAGRIAQFLCPWLFLNFLFTPVSFLPILLNKQKDYFWINLVALIFILFFGIFAFYNKLDFSTCILGLSFLQGFLLFILILWFIFQIKKLKINQSKIIKQKT